MKQTSTQTDITAEHNDLCDQLGRDNFDKHHTEWLFLVATTDFRTFEYAVPCAEIGDIKCRIQSDTSELVLGKDGFLIFLN